MEAARADDALPQRRDIVVMGASAGGRVDLIACRNTLMYFNADVQSRIYRAFHFALKSEAFLLLGKSEMLLTRTEMFLPVDLKRRLFQRVSPQGEDRSNGRAGVPDDARLACA